MPHHTGAHGGRRRRAIPSPLYRLVSRVAVILVMVAAGLAATFTSSQLPGAPSAAHAETIWPAAVNTATLSTPDQCINTLDCDVATIDSWSIAQRIAFVKALQNGPAQSFQSGFQDWNAILGILYFFEFRNLGASGSWISYTDAGILIGIERGLALALGFPPKPTLDTDSGASLWETFLNDLKAGKLDLATNKIQHDYEWGVAEQTATNWGSKQAPSGVTPSASETTWFNFSQAFRWIMQNEGPFATALGIINQAPLTDLFNTFTSVNNVYSTFFFAELAWESSAVYDALQAVLQQKWVTNSASVLSLLNTISSGESSCTSCNSVPTIALPSLYAVFDIPGGGAFYTDWTANGGASGPLGAATGDWADITGGQQQPFTGGRIYWSSATGTHGIHGSAYTDYAGLGGPGSQLGFPASDAISEPGSGLQWQFNGTSCGTTGLAGSGSVILADGPTYTAGTTSPGSEVQGCIYQAYAKRYGGPGGVLAYPTTNEQAMATGRVSYFTGGSTKPGCSTGSDPGDGVTTAAIYWDGSAHDVTGCIFALYYSLGEAAGQLGFPVDDAYAISGGGYQQDFQNGTISGGSGGYSVSYGGRWVVGHAAHAGNDYPYETVGQFEHQDQGIDAWAEYYGQCDSFAAWKVYENLAGGAAQEPGVPVPAVGWQPSDASVSPVNQDTWFNADNWDVKGRAAGWTVNTVPAPGTIAYWPNATADPQDGHPTSPNGIGEFGHVGYVTDVYPDGSVTIESYNLRLNGEYSVLHMAYGQSAVDTSFSQGSFTVPWPTYFIHVGDGIGSPTPATPEPASGTVSAGYPGQVKVIGPGSSSSQFSLGNVWYLRSGHGEIGQEEWTHTNGATAVSTATWTPSGLAASACYRVDAFVPDNYSDNPVAVYTISDAKGTAMAAVNDNQYTNDWAELGVYQANGSGGITVRLDDRGTTGLYVAADAMRFWRQTSCSGYGDVSPIIGPGSLSGSWSTDSGHGFFGNEKYSATHGTVLQDYASYSPHLLAEGCYEVFAYVPDNYSDNNATTYEILEQWHGDFWPQVNENAFTNQFTDLGAFMARSDGSLPVTLEDLGPAGQYVAADALAFTLDANCVGVGESGTGLGNVYQSNQVGPGSPPADFSTTNSWYTQLGHGYTQHELWTHDNGSTADSTATWTFYGSANTCYSVAAYIPDNYADNPQAHYSVGTSSEGLALTLNQQNYTNQFIYLAAVTTGSGGIVTVHLNDEGPVTDSTGKPLYTAADAMQFSQGGTGC